MSINELMDKEIIHTHTQFYIYNSYIYMIIIYIYMCIYKIYIYTHIRTVEYYSVIKNEILPTWIELKGVMLSEVNWTEKDKIPHALS